MVQPHRFTFDAGQYLLLKVHPNGTRRSYSLWSDPSNAHGFELFVEVIPNGVGSHFLSTLPFGSDVEFLAPLGQFTVPTTITPATPLVFIATGSGIAPFQLFC
jgi:ring-1,2-phenylacetyl-CoA epoxidase subunit PaaE